MRGTATQVALGLCTGCAGVPAHRVRPSVSTSACAGGSMVRSCDGCATTPNALRAAVWSSQAVAPLAQGLLPDQTPKFLSYCRGQNRRLLLCQSRTGKPMVRRNPACYPKASTLTDRWADPGPCRPTSSIFHPAVELSESPVVLRLPGRAMAPVGLPPSPPCRTLGFSCARLLPSTRDSFKDGCF